MNRRPLARTILAALLGVTPAPVQTLLATAAPQSPGVEQIRGDQWHLRYLHAVEAQRISQGEGVTVAVPDTGVAPHPDLRDNLLAGIDTIRGHNVDGHQDLDGHGTGMAGLIAAHGRGDKLGAIGIAPKAKILPIRGKETNAGGNTEDLATGIHFAIAEGADVISISGVAGASVRLQQAVREALTADIIVVAGAGNVPNETNVGYPAREPGVIAVGGIDQKGYHAAVSIAGPEIDVVAPAVDIYSTGIDGKYRKGTGTSDATAIVAGAAALIRAKYPDVPAQEVAHRLTATAVDKGPPGRDDEYGYGLIDLVAALTADVPPLGFESAAPASDGGDGGATARGLATLGVLVAAGGGYLLWRRRRRADDPPPRISR